MKNIQNRLIVLLVAILISTPNAFAQFTQGLNTDQLHTYKKVGINTNNPTSPLEIHSTGTLGGIFNPATAYLKITDGTTTMLVDGNEIHSNQSLVFGSSYTSDFKFRNVDGSGFEDLLLIKSDGKVGIGTATPQSNLHISSGTDGDAILTLSSDEDNNNEFDNSLIQLRQDGGRLGVNIGYDEANFGSNIFGIGRRLTNVDYWDTFIINTTNGNIGIGTNQTTSYKLSVQGKVRAEEVKVYTGWADFVFEDDYDLPTLQEVEQYIKINKHLPEIPSAEEVAENGVSLGEMDSKLLQKIEELTLYIIEQEKRIKQLEALK
ncbi:hypothetical protein QQ020_26630 [Fulvivirgaceae bacterium BMA12]|uniref:Peptidase S74 domain-containing protein n=1 Tax=Agaribacillus aureus TaxID=3051825 RepID=A0ABT8LD29_9BACT|nr:hypothetical protein [Fulvivirgaceae bacterium BMA12]